MVAAVYPSPYSYSVPAPAPPAAVSPLSAHKLRTYVVLTAKSSRGRLASFEDAGYSTASTSASSSAASSPAASPQRATGKTLRIPDECLAYESYAAVASTSPTRDLRWSDISRPAAPTTVAAVPTVANGGRMLSLRARRRQMQRATSATPNDHIEAHALELCFEFLALADLQRAAATCKEFRAVVTGSARLPVALYARAWRASTTLPRAYAQLAFAPALEMLQQRARAATAPYALATRSHTATRADATVELLNNSLLRVLTRGAVDSARGVRALPELPCARALDKRVSYFEVAMSGCGSVGVASLSDAATRRAYGYGSDEHVGWKGVSCGYHGNDGDFVFNDGAAPYGGEWTPYGPSWGVRKPTAAAAKHGGDDGADSSEDNQADEAAWPVVGCGLDLAARRVFFTLNGTFLGFATFALPEGEYAAAVSLHEFNDRAVLNAGSAPFRFDIEGFCASL